MLRRSLLAFMTLLILLTSGCSAESSASSEQGMYDTEFTDRDSEVEWDRAEAVWIELTGETASIEGSGASFADGTLQITQEGTYVLSGELQGQIQVSVTEEEKVWIVLNGVSVHCEDGAALYIAEADKVFITLEAETQNALSSGAEYDLTIDDGMDGVIFSRADLTLNGLGSLQVTSQYGHAVVSKDDLVITSGNYEIESVSGGLYGKDCVKIAGGTFLLKTGTDGIQSSNSEDAERGFVYIEDGEFTIEAGKDAIQAETALLIRGGTFSILTNGGHTNAETKEDSAWGRQRPGSFGGMMEDSAEDSSSDSESAKGLKAGVSLEISGGVFQIDSADDALHSNGTICISGGEMTLSSGDDGLHADGSLEISGGQLEILQSYEGIEGLSVTISGGAISVVASDDGINAAGGSDTGDFSRPGRDGFLSSETEEMFIEILGGALEVNASGDGLDSNGSILVAGGTVYVSGAENSGNGALDYATTAEITGGVVIAAGMSGMAQGFSSSSSQCSALIRLDTQTDAAVRVLNDQGETLMEYQPPKQYDSLVISSPDLELGQSYTICAGDWSETIEWTTTTINSGEFMGFGDRGGRDMGGRGMGGR